ncbi:MAG: prepilin-type N-terminal cleavage/methylation domain-containing protein [Candidatus Harrisonbacteria bacterium]|nr:prepilin-type N-terminal cleavage/methylation domain-containing protein [Candidatus Harrisonbacteria bacterium]
MLNSKKGFTLVEILVVVAIIGLLSSVFVIGLAGVRSRGRDTKRIADLKQVQNAMELYYAKCGYYPGSQSSGACSNTGDPGTWGPETTAGTVQNVLVNGGIGIPKIPQDPLAGGNYGYAVDPTRQSYVLAAILENDKDPALVASTYNVDITWTAKTTGFPACSGTKAYCVKF